MVSSSSLCVATLVASYMIITIIASPITSLPSMMPISGGAPVLPAGAPGAVVPVQQWLNTPPFCQQSSSCPSSTPYEIERAKCTGEQSGTKCCLTGQQILCSNINPSGGPSSPLGAAGAPSLSPLSGIGNIIPNSAAITPSMMSNAGPGVGSASTFINGLNTALTPLLTLPSSSSSVTGIIGAIGNGIVNLANGGASGATGIALPSSLLLGSTARPSSSLPAMGANGVTGMAALPSGLPSSLPVLANGVTGSPIAINPLPSDPINMPSQQQPPLTNMPIIAGSPPVGMTGAVGMPPIDIPSSTPASPSLPIGITGAAGMPPIDGLQLPLSSPLSLSPVSGAPVATAATTNGFQLQSLSVGAPGGPFGSSVITGAPLQTGPGSVAAAAAATWFGSGPICGSTATCPDGWSFLASARCANGDCCLIGQKVYCQPISRGPHGGGPGGLGVNTIGVINAGPGGPGFAPH